MRGVLLTVAVLLLAGCTASTTAVPAASPVSLPSPAAAAAPLGATARDGQFEFVVKSMKRAPSVTSPVHDYTHSTAQGEFIILDVSVTNVSDQPQTYLSANQNIVIDGKQIKDATEASVTLNDNAISRLNPGLGIDTQIAFDVPVGAVPNYVELHDATTSPGVYVSLIA